MIQMALFFLIVMWAFIFLALSPDFKEGSPGKVKWTDKVVVATNQMQKKSYVAQ